MHIGNIRLPNVFEKGPVTVKMPISKNLLLLLLLLCFETSAWDIAGTVINGLHPGPPFLYSGGIYARSRSPGAHFIELVINDHFSSLTITMATVLHSQSKSRMSLYLSLMTSSMKWAPPNPLSWGKNTPPILEKNTFLSWKLITIGGKSSWEKGPQSTLFPLCVQVGGGGGGYSNRTIIQCLCMAAWGDFCTTVVKLLEGKIIISITVMIKRLLIGILEWFHFVKLIIQYFKLNHN